MKQGLTLDALAGQVYIVAVNEAKLSSHEFVTPEHFLYGMLLFELGSRLVDGGGGNVAKIGEDLNAYFEGYGFGPKVEHPIESLEFVALMEGAIEFALSMKKSEVGLDDILVAMLDLKDNFAARIMKKHGVHFVKIINFLNGVDLAEAAKKRGGLNSKMPKKQAAHAGVEENAPETKPLEKFAVNMVDAADNGQYGPLIGREAELEEIVLLLCRRTKNNPVLVGDSGVGKTAIVEGLAARIAAGHVPAALANSNIYHIDMSVVLAGTRYRGDFEDRLLGILEAASAEKGAIIYVDDIHTVIGTGAVAGGAIDASSMIKPYLNKNRLRFIGTTTFEDYKKFFERNPALMRRFQKVDINEPSKQETMEILEGLIEEYEEHHGVKYTHESLEAAIDLTSKYVHATRLPDKAIDVLDHSGAQVAYKYKSKRGRPYINPEDIEQAVSMMTKIPESSISADERLGLVNLENQLKEHVFGQDAAISAVVSSIKSSRLGLNDPEKPMTSLLFVGPTGVGKTEIARTLANVLNIKLLRFDMSEYGEQHSTARLVGSPPGYIGHGEGGLLTDAVRKTPHAVLLLDEIEKAHPSILNMLLQVMDYGRLTDSQGKNADFRNIVLIMTSNAGASSLGRKMIGFDDKADPGALKTQIDKIFSPEFRNRLNKIVQFNALTRPMALKIARKAVETLSGRMKERGVKIRADDAALAFIADKGFSAEYGAREIIRVVEGQVKDEIVEYMLSGDSPDFIQLTISDEQLAIKTPVAVRVVQREDELVE
ncbi:MAG: AAA family ATPase [Clostridiales bacterium]|jgi:ATP-dependent Clp protease ATP-binding subunit ClpA|nr:AAA family ATPase [Clostridiales bacterium]